MLNNKVALKLLSMLFPRHNQPCSAIVKPYFLNLTERRLLEYQECVAENYPGDLAQMLFTVDIALQKKIS